MLPQTLTLHMSTVELVWNISLVILSTINDYLYFCGFNWTEFSTYLCKKCWLITCLIKGSPVTCGATYFGGFRH